MPDPVSGVMAAVSVGSSVIGGNAAKKASKAQQKADMAAIEEQRAAREEMRTLLQPYVDAGTPALQQMMALSGLAPSSTNWTAYAQSNPELMAAYQAQAQGSPGLREALASKGGYFNAIASGMDLSKLGDAPTPGLSLDEFAQQWHQQRGGDISPFQTAGGAEAQRAAIAQIEADPIFQSLVQQGEEGILQNASATGGLRGGNVQGALAQFRPQMLNQRINEQYARLAGLAQAGQNSAAGVGSAGLGVASNIGSLLQDAGAAKAGGALAQGQMLSGILGGIGQVAGAGIGGFGKNYGPIVPGQGIF